jgi:hypothetical protein
MTHKKPLPLLSTADLDALSRALSKEAEGEGLRMAVAGGFAMNLYGSRRLTADLDVIADRELDPYQYAEAGLTKAGRMAFGGQKFKTRNKVPVDWIVRQDRAAELYREALEMARKAPGGLPYRIVPATYLAAMKFWANRPKDHEDLKVLLSLGAVNLRQVRGIIRRTLGADAAMEFSSLLTELRLRMQRGE